MIKIKLDDTTIQVPTDWSDIRLGDYEQWFEKQPQSKLDYVRFVADVCNVDDQLLLQSPAELFNVIVSKIEFVFRLQVDPSPSMLVDGVRYCVPIAEKLTLGEWVDIDATLQSESKTKISEILAIVCRPVGEEYDADNIEQRKELFRNLPCDKALPLLAFFFAQKAAIRENFAPLFDGSGSGKPVSKGYQNFCSRWGWYKTIADLAKDKIYLFDTITRKTVVEVFGFLLYQIDKSKAEDEQYKFERQINRR